MFPKLEKAEGLWGRSGGGGPGPQHPPVREDSFLSPAPKRGGRQTLFPPWAVCWGSAPGRVGGELLRGGSPSSPLASPVYLCICVILKNGSFFSFP